MTAQVLKHRLFNTPLDTTLSMEQAQAAAAGSL